MASPSKPNYLLFNTTKEREQILKTLNRQKKEIDDLKAQLQARKDTPQVEAKQEDTYTKEYVTMQFEKIRDQRQEIEGLRSEMRQIDKSRLKRIKELEEFIEELKDRTPIGAEDLNAQVHYLLQVLRLEAEERDTFAPHSKSEIQDKIARVVDNLIMLYKYPYRHPDRFEDMKTIAETFSRLGYPVELWMVVYDKDVTTTKEDEWADKLNV